jgi:ApeA N-terminal domain 1
MGINMAGSKAMKQTMFDEFQIKGYWWLPETENKVAGILFYKHDNIKLELIGTLSQKNISHIFDGIKKVDIILGYSDKGEEFTLMNCINSNFSFNTPGFMTETYTINSFLVGGHFNSLDEISFHSMAIYPTYFSKWTSKSPFKLEYSLNDGKVKSINFTEPKMFSEYIEPINAKIEETYITNFSGDFNEKINWGYKGGFKIIPDEWQSFEWFRKTMFKVRNLYTLFIGYPTYFENLIFYGDEELIDSQTHRKKYSYFLQQKDVKIKNKFNWHDAMINYGDIHHNLKDIFSAWFEKEEILKTVTDLYFSDFYRDMYIETKFLNSVQTLEIYHRRLFDGKIFDDAKYQEYSAKVIEYIQSKLPSEFCEKIEGMLRHGNEYSLSKRLRELINSLNPETKSYLFGNSDNRAKFVQQLVDTRNYLTHYDVSDKKNILKGSQIFYAIQRLKALATILLFKEIGIDEKLILTKIQDSKQYSYSITEAKKILN